MNWRKVTTEADLLVAKGIRRAVFIEEQGIAEELEHDQYDALTPDCTHIIVCDDEQQPIGTGRLRIVEDAVGGADGSVAGSVRSSVEDAEDSTTGEKDGVILVGKLERISTLQHARGHGCGKIIVRALEELAKGAGASKVKLGAQLPVRGFYEQLDYKVVSEVFVEAGIEHVLMEKELNNIEKVTITDDIRFESVNESTQTQARELILQGFKEHFGFLDTSLNSDLNDIIQNYVRPGYIFLVGVLQNEVVCCGALIRDNENTGRIVRMSVKKEYRRNGYASRMIEVLEEMAKDRGYAKIMLKTLHHWSDAVGFYSAKGYMKDKIDEDSIIMIKTL